MNVVRELENEFIDFAFGMGKAMGMPDLHVKLIGIMFMEKEPVALEDLAIKSGYSLSAVSTAMKLLEQVHGAKKSRILGSKKIYYTIEKDTAKFMRESLKQISELKIKPSNKHVPEIIKKYEEKAKTDKLLKEKLHIVKDYYHQMKKIDKIMEKTIEELAKI